MEWSLLLLPIGWLALLVGIHCAFTRHKPIDYERLALHVAFMAMIGPIGEIFVGTLYQQITGFPLWQYKVLPTHEGYTSFYAPVIWGVAGAYTYYIQEVLGVWSTRANSQRAALQMIETISLEAAINVTFYVLAGTLIFYYTPGDLGHITSLQTLPFYFVLGLIDMSSIRRMSDYPRFCAAMCLALMFVVVYMTS